MSQSERGFVQTFHADRQENAGRLTARAAALLAWAVTEGAALLLLLVVVVSFPPWRWGGDWLMFGPFLMVIVVLSALGVALVREIVELNVGRDEIAADRDGLTCTWIRRSRRSSRHVAWSQLLDVALSTDGRVVSARTPPVSTWKVTRLGTEQQRAGLVVDLKAWIASQPVTQPVNSVLPPYLPPGWRTTIRTDGLLLHEKPWRRRAQGLGFGLFAAALWACTVVLTRSTSYQKIFDWVLGYLALSATCLAISKLFTEQVWLVEPGSLRVGRAWLHTGRWVRSSKQVTALQFSRVEIDGNDNGYICLFPEVSHGSLGDLMRLPDDKAAEFRALGHWLAIKADLPLTDHTLSIKPST